MSFLNTTPLVWGMLHGPQRDCFDLSFATPAECADAIESGAAEIGIVPVVEIERLGMEPIPGVGIACRGDVRSILLFSKKPAQQIRTLAADTSSRTSVMLARILLEERYGASPEIIPLAPDLESMLEQADAALIIGDPALHLDPARSPYRALDLGAEWFEHTGLPMVFAIWAARGIAVTADLVESFAASYRFGAAHVEEIVAIEAAARGIPATVAREYLTRHIVFELSEREHEGMRLFLSKAAARSHASA